MRFVNNAWNVWSGVGVRAVTEGGNVVFQQRQAGDWRDILSIPLATLHDHYEEWLEQRGLGEEEQEVE